MTTEHVPVAEVNRLITSLLPQHQIDEVYGRMDMYMDGNQWCCITRGLCLADPQCRAGFGDTKEDAVRDLFGGTR